MAEVKNICLEALERHCERGDKGRLDFNRGTYEGHIYTDDHLIVHAQLAGLDGVPALFRLFDWGDAETTWQAGIVPEQSTLHLTIQAACILYAEQLQDRAEIEERQKGYIDQVLAAPEMVAGQTGGLESVLKHYTVSLECTDDTYLPGGFVFADATKSSYVIGSGDDCDVVLRNSTVHLLHCGVILERGSVLVWDLGAQTGVKVNGKPITQDILKVGDVMSLGALDLRVRFQLRRPTINRPKPVAVAASDAKAGPVPETKAPAPSKEMPKGAITYDKVSRQLKDSGKGVGFLSKLTTLFGPRKHK